MNKITEYITSLTHLYGLVHKDKVIEIYNMQNQDKIENIDTVRLKAGKIGIDIADLDKNFVEVIDDYFVHETILEFDDFRTQLGQRYGKPFYIPDQEELLRYKDDTYFEMSKEYDDLLKYVTKNLLNGDERLGEAISEDIQGYCQYGFSPSSIFDLFNQRNISFKDEKQINDVIQLVMKLANNTRLWENNGHTPDEIVNLMGKLKSKNATKSKVIGRNDPCPCGSGKKYKICCLGNEE
ncbi:MAG TPA: SEC-C metal-binding domain-containing protein [Clostridiaceae bacterium]